MLPIKTTIYCVGSITVAAYLETMDLVAEVILVKLELEEDALQVRHLVSQRAQLAFALMQLGSRILELYDIHELSLAIKIT